MSHAEGKMSIRHLGTVDIDWHSEHNHIFPCIDQAFGSTWEHYEQESIPNCSCFIKLIASFQERREGAS